VFPLAIRHPSFDSTLSVLHACGTFDVVIPFFFFLFGMVIGSFLNVCIARIPEGISIVSPGSKCPRCATPIKPYDNIPVFGWLLLQGKCRNCHLPISPMYPIVELLTGACFVLTYYTYGITLPTFKYLVFGCLLIILIVTDIRVRILPDAVNAFGFGAGLAFATRVLPDGIGEPLVRLEHLPAMLVGVLEALLGAAFGGFLLWGAAAVYRLVRKREGMGMGDVKMMAMVGTFLGLRGSFLTILLGTLLGSIIGLVLIVVLFLVGWKSDLAKRASRRGLGQVRSLEWTICSQYQLPLGSFLGIACFLVVLAVPWVGWPPTLGSPVFRP
jgi:leader peptidase (prepilin peptidase) / N-methyltransferase